VRPLRGERRLRAEGRAWMGHRRWHSRLGAGGDGGRRGVERGRRGSGCRRTTIETRGATSGDGPAAWRSGRRGNADPTRVRRPRRVVASRRSAPPRRHGIFAPQLAGRRSGPGAGAGRRTPESWTPTNNARWGPESWARVVDTHQQRPLGPNRGHPPTTPTGAASAATAGIGRGSWARIVTNRGHPSTTPTVAGCPNRGHPPTTPSGCPNRGHPPTTPSGAASAAIRRNRGQASIGPGRPSRRRAEGVLNQAESAPQSWTPTNNTLWGGVSGDPPESWTGIDRNLARSPGTW